MSPVSGGGLHTKKPCLTAIGIFCPYDLVKIPVVPIFFLTNPPASGVLLHLTPTKSLSILVGCLTVAEWSGVESQRKAYIIPTWHLPSSLISIKHLCVVKSWILYSMFPQFKYFKVLILAERVYLSWMCLYSKRFKWHIFTWTKTYTLVNWPYLTESSTDLTKFWDYLWFDEYFYM